MIEIFSLEFGLVEFWLMVSFLSLFFVHLFYLIFTACFSRSGRKRKGNPSQIPSFSIIIPSRNYEQHLRELIPSLLKQNYPDFEVVVVDDCSTDGTEWYLASLKLESNKLKTSRIVQETDFPNALAITIGIRAATKEWVLFLNPLCRVDSDQWLEEFAKGITPEKEVITGYVKTTKKEGTMKWFFRYENLDNSLLYGAARWFGIAMPTNEINIAYKREAFLERRGFAAVLDSPFCENELYINKVSTRKNTICHFDRNTTVNYIGDLDWYDALNFKKKQLLLRKKFTVGQSVYLWINTYSRLLFDGLFVALVIISPWRLYVAAFWLFKMVHELIWGIVAQKRVGERNCFPGLLFYRSILPLLNSTISLNQLFTGRKRKWK